MCGIGGVMMFPKDRTVEELTYLRLLTKNIANENEVRGRDSTGFVAFSKKGIGLFKHPVPASRMTETKAYTDFMAKSLNKNTATVLIHTRAGTKGSEKNNLNNHPIESARYIGVHNGIIYNDDALFEKYNLHRAAQVDSEIIFRLLDTVGDKPEDSGLKWVAEKLQGMFTTAFVPKKERNKMFLIRNDNPVTMVYIESLNIIAFASQAHFLRDAIADANEYTSLTIDLISHCVWHEPMRQTIYSFDMNESNPLEQLNQVPQSFKENWSYDDNQWAGWGYDEQSFFQKNATEVAGEQEEAVSIASILTKLSSAELEAMDKHIDIMTTNAWSEGWTEGRKSLDEEMTHKISIAHEEGYNTGFDDGFDDGSNYEKGLAERKAVTV
jgi:glucosamine 6-phosphate synthetase-like amidotransferase/phosphosugar isomerase protein